MYCAAAAVATRQGRRPAAASPPGGGVGGWPAPPRPCSRSRSPIRGRRCWGRAGPGRAGRPGAAGDRTRRPREWPAWPARTASTPTRPATGAAGPVGRQGSPPWSLLRAAHLRHRHLPASRITSQHGPPSSRKRYGRRGLPNHLAFVKQAVTSQPGPEALRGGDDLGLVGPSGRQRQDGEVPSGYLPGLAWTDGCD